ncbi:MAG: NCS2 family permease [Candidatus Zixiibacteriota bacterium]|nr:MAG: NCS2 family permease [candidate division Zixibacteria bacterium]
MLDGLKRYFHFERHQTNFKREILGGITTFFTMSYIIIVNPKILEAAGIPFGPSMAATILAAFFGTLTMGIYARRPFAIAPYMGENAFIAFTVCGVLGYSWQTALGAIFIGGVLFTLVSALKIRSWLAAAIPTSLKISFAVGIGLYLTFIGLNETGIVTLGVPGAPVHVGELGTTPVILAVVCFLLVSILMIRKVTGALLLGILVTTILAFVFKAAETPSEFISLPPSLEPIFLELDIAGAFTWGFFSVILTVFVMDFVDTTGTLLGLSFKAGLLDENGNLPEIEKPMMCDSTATVIGALLGTTTTGTFIESAAGMEAGGRSGFTSVVTALFFLAGLFFAPFLTAVPPCAYGPAVIIVGLLMMTTITQIEFNDLTEAIPAFCVIVLMSFTYNLGIGITAGFAVYPIMKIFAGRIREVNAGMWILAAISILFFIFYPY